ncbi:MAG: hypothetical protein GXY07_00190 [Candidatus Hydrogenedentes bacterium]|nr:hypothetical protein [Candidatus Hydrogenedentota bacterium]
MRILALLSALALCVSYAIPASSGETAEGIEKVLRGAGIGMAFDVFVDTHPEAVYSDDALRGTPVTKETPGAMLIVHDQDPFLGHYSFANFGFKEGSLYELVAVWKGEAAVMRAHALSFLSSVMKRHGRPYERKSILVYPGSPEEQPVAVFCWRKNGVASLAFYTPPPAGAKDPIGTLSYAQFSEDSPFLADIFDKKPTRTDQHEKVWKDVEDIVAALK